MTDSTRQERSVPKLRQLAGPGVAGLERDTPVYHVDIDKKELDTLLAHPVEFFKRLGVGPEQGIGLNGTINVNIVQVNTGTQAIEWCCYVVGDTTTCHNH